MLKDYLLNRCMNEWMDKKYISVIFSSEVRDAKEWLEKGNVVQKKMWTQISVQIIEIA